MSVFQRLGNILSAIIRVVCPPLHNALTSAYQEKKNLKCFLGFVAGFGLGQLYCVCFINNVRFPYHMEAFLSLLISVLCGLGNAVSTQIRCISLLTFPMFCGKPGRGVLKAVVLTFVVAGPITNMGLNAKEVVRVFACSAQLSYNLSRAKYAMLAPPIRRAVLGSKIAVGEIHDALRSIHVVSSPLEREMNGSEELERSRREDDIIDHLLGNSRRRRSDVIEKKYEHKKNDKQKDVYLNDYLKKVEYRCQGVLSRGVMGCMKGFRSAYRECRKAVSRRAAAAICWPLRLPHVCNVMHFVGGHDICNSRANIDPGLGEGYGSFKKLNEQLAKNFKDAKVRYKVTNVRDLEYNIQDAKEMGDRAQRAFEEKHTIMQSAITVVKFCLALLFLRVVFAARTYHDMYLTSIDHDNVYITDYFQRIDHRRGSMNKHTLLPLKKMERSRYTDVHSTAFLTADRHKFLNQIPKLMLEVVTATTFVMLDRLFYEALDVVRQHSAVERTLHGTHDLDVDVEGTGMMANMVRRMVSELNSDVDVHRTVTNEPCLPRPSLMRPVFFMKIYGGYLGILMLLYFNRYTLRLKRLICSYFYPRREKQRILHLYNDILKKRMKMQKTLRRKAVQAVRAHYLSGESLLSVRMKFPRLLGWLRIFPAGKMKCLICGEAEPGNSRLNTNDSSWHSCSKPKCPFVYCPECWQDVGEGCLACDPSLAELSDIDSLSEDERPRH